MATGDIALRKVWKFALDPFSSYVAMPAGSIVLHVGVQDGTVTVWASVDPEQTTMMRCLKVYGTGLSIHPDEQHIGSVQDGPYVWHVFDAGEYPVEDTD